MRASRGKWLATAFAVLTLVGAALPAAASAWGPPTRTQLEIDNMDGITQWFLRTWYGTDYVACNTACAALERATPTNPTVETMSQASSAAVNQTTAGSPGADDDSVDRVWVESKIQAQRVLTMTGPAYKSAEGVLDPLKPSASPLLPPEAKIGIAIVNAIRLHHAAADQVQRAKMIMRNARRYLELGYDIPIANGIQDWVLWDNSPLSDCAHATYVPGNCPPRINGLVALFLDTSQPTWMERVDGSSDACYRFDRGFPLPHGVLDLAWTYATCNAYDVNATETSRAHAWGVTFDSMLAGNKPSATSANWSSQFPGSLDPSIDVVVDVPDAVDFATAREWFAQMLDSGSTPELNAWIDSVLGGSWHDPRVSYPAVPDCRGVTTDVCQQRLTAAGFTATPSTAVLPASEAVWNVGANMVATTDPAPSIKVRADRAITIYTNPATVTAPTADMKAAASTVATRNLKTLSANGYTLNGLTEVMTRCFQLTTAAGLANSLCSTSPLVLIGRDAPLARANAITGQTSKPARVQLHVGPRTPVLDGSGVFNGKPGGGCSASTQLLPVRHCDEFPNISTEEGYQQPLAPSGLPALSWESQSGSQRIVDLFTKFRSTDPAGGSTNFRGCGLPVGTGTDSAFLEVPLGAGTTFSSVALCATKDP